MEHSFQLYMVITTEDITNLLACEGGGFDYWAEICWDEADYEAARKRLAAKQSDSILCYEDVEAEILEAGGKLKVYDREEDKDYELTLAGLLDGFRLFAESNKSIDLDDMDVAMADQILQMAVFKEVIYG